MKDGAEKRTRKEQAGKITNVLYGLGTLAGTRAADLADEIKLTRQRVTKILTKTKSIREETAIRYFTESLATMDLNEIGGQVQQQGGQHYQAFPFSILDYISLCRYGFVRGNMVKYTVRAGLKHDPLIDIAKAGSLLPALRYETEMEHKEYVPGSLDFLGFSRKAATLKFIDVNEIPGLETQNILLKMAVLNSNDDFYDLEIMYRKALEY